MLAWDRVMLGNVQTGKQLLRQVELFRFRKVTDVASVDGQRRLDRHRIDVGDRFLERPGDIRIGFLFEADVRVADLQKQRRAGDGAGGFFRGRKGQVNRRQNAGGKDEQGS